MVRNPQYRQALRNVTITSHKCPENEQLRVFGMSPGCIWGRLPNPGVVDPGSAPTSQRRNGGFYASEGWWPRAKAEGRNPGQLFGSNNNTLRNLLFRLDQSPKGPGRPTP